MSVRRIIPRLMPLLFLCSCINDDMEPGSRHYGNTSVIRFIVGSEALQTRAAVETDGNTLVDNGFNVIADWKDDDSNSHEYINASVTYSGGSFSESGKDYYMPGSGSLDFYGYYIPAAAGLTATRTEAGEAPHIEVSDMLNSQYDVLVALKEGVQYDASGLIPFQFSHIFAGIYFTLDADNSLSGTIGNVTIANLSNSGTYTIGSGWGTLGSTIDYTVDYSATSTKEDALLVIPQGITSSNVVSIKFTPTGGEETTLTTVTTLPTSTLSPGYRYNFKLKVEKSGVSISSVSIDTWTPVDTSADSDFNQKKTI